MHPYSHDSFCIGTVLMDIEFKKLLPLVPNVGINTSVAKEHVPKIKPCIFLIKAHCQAILNTLPFGKI